ncbi:endonuclease/exonuclease/phosphatase family protein [Streptomyces cremeus]|uniref:Endonuclease/exonuclease/phosphatase family protein n=1 Tax=Streptomyces cremeus TaxID=66881 RepID=A0ABV5P7G5_STRCM
MRRPVTLLSLLFAGPALLGFAPAPHAVTAPPAATEVRVLTYNICGASCPDSQGYDNRRRLDVVVDEAVGARWKADQVHLQELCRGQYDELVNRLGPHGFTGHFTTTEGNRASCENKDYGVGVLVRGTVRDTRVLDLTQGGEKEKIKVPCVRSVLRGHDNWACSVHLYWNEKEIREGEARRLGRQARAWQHQGTPVVLAGDFNASPLAREMGEFYTPEAGGGHGRFVEGDERDKRYFDRRACDPAQHTRCRSGEPTFQRKKIDYVFFSDGDFRNVKADVRKQDREVSDHRLLSATATWTKPGS